MTGPSASNGVASQHERPVELIDGSIKDAHFDTEPIVECAAICFVSPRRGDAIRLEMWETDASFSKDRKPVKVNRTLRKQTDETKGL